MTCLNSIDFAPKVKSRGADGNKKLVTGTSTYKGSELLPPVFLEVLKPVYMALSETTLLQGVCLEQLKM